jgi:hypothetical protein
MLGLSNGVKMIEAGGAAFQSLRTEAKSLASNEVLLKRSAPQS